MLSTVARRDQILQAVQEQRKVRVSRLAQHFGVSAVTIRTDLRAMTSAGLLARQHGGARLVGEAVPEAPLSEKRVIHRDRKLRIAARAAQLVAPDDKLILDAGSTTLMLSQRLPGGMPLTVFTNSLPIANGLNHAAGMRLIVSGGTLRQASQSLQGPQAEASLQSLFFDKLFLGADGFDPDFGLSTHDMADARLNARMVEHARQVIVLADGSKFGRLCLHLICGLENVHTVISDATMPMAMRAALSARGIEILIAEDE
ncbi:DeoR/GlpR family DNA-binding transcription regulator [Pseudoduganella sp. OTU4001]|uniref:DeoR/GlpR family DNA-binding transcription regulator n=1 Tax=Pseudoduganella sp. OTU4001 TaxID=3043854 RepID=UPI00313E6718